MNFIRHALMGFQGTQWKKPGIDEYLRFIPKMALNFTDWTTPLSGRKIWFNLRHHQRRLCNFTPWNISFHLRHVSKKLVWPKGVKIEAEKGWVVKEWKFRKKEEILLYQFFNWFNFAFMVCAWFAPRSGLKVEFVLFEAEKVTARRGSEILPASLSRSASKSTNSNF